MFFTTSILTLGLLTIPAVLLIRGIKTWRQALAPRTERSFDSIQQELSDNIGISFVLGVAFASLALAVGWEFINPDPNMMWAVCAGTIAALLLSISCLSLLLLFAVNRDHALNGHQSLTSNG